MERLCTGILLSAMSGASHNALAWASQTETEVTMHRQTAHCNERGLPQCLGLGQPDRNRSKLPTAMSMASHNALAWASQTETEVTMHRQTAHCNERGLPQHLGLGYAGTA
eukprot:1161702-Pelagomonas_calceolata.AAC.13